MLLSRLLKVLSARSNASANQLAVLIISQVMGMYFVASVLLLRMNLPTRYRASVTSALGGDIQFDFYHRWFDVIFLSAALATIVVSVLDRKAQNSIRLS